MYSASSSSGMAVISLLLLLPQHQPEIGREGAHHMDRGPVAIGRATQGLAVDRYTALERTDNATHPASEHRLELLRVEHPKHPQERVGRRDAVLQGQEAAQPIGLEPPPQGDVLEAVGIREHGAHRDHQDLPEVVAGAVTWTARVFQLTQCLHQARSRSTHAVRPKDESRRVFERVHKMAT